VTGEVGARRQVLAGRGVQVALLGRPVALEFGEHGGEHGAAADPVGGGLEVGEEALDRAVLLDQDVEEVGSVRIGVRRVMVRVWLLGHHGHVVPTM